MILSGNTDVEAIRRLEAGLPPVSKKRDLARAIQPVLVGVIGLLGVIGYMIAKDR